MMAMVPTQQPEADLWTAELAALRYAIWARKPDAIARLKLRVEKLDNEIGALVLRRSYVEDGTVLEGNLTNQINGLLLKMRDIEAVGRDVRSSLLDHDAGATPDAAMKARPVLDDEGDVRGLVATDPGTDDLNSDLKRAASEIRAGWMVITQANRPLAAVYDEMPSVGRGDYGKVAMALERQYKRWVVLLHRKRISPWAVEDVVCHGFSRRESSTRRRCSEERVYRELKEGLLVYLDEYPEPVTSSTLDEAESQC